MSQIGGLCFIALFIYLALWAYDLWPHRAWRLLVPRNLKLIWGYLGMRYECIRFAKAYKAFEDTPAYQRRHENDGGSNGKA